MSMYGKDVDLVKQQKNYYPDPPTYNTTKTARIEENYDGEVMEEEPVECTPGMFLHPIGLLRLFELAMFFTLQWLVQITCGNDACTMIMNVFGYTALGQVFVLIIFLGLSIMCAFIILFTVLNFHRAFPRLIRAVEKLYAILGVFFMFIAGILGTWMAVLTRNPEVNYQGRGVGHIKGQWIAAAVLEFLMVGLYIFDFWLQRKENYPFGIKRYNSDAYPTRLELENGVTFHGHGGYSPGYDTKTTKTTTTTTQQQYIPSKGFEPLAVPPYQPAARAYTPPQSYNPPQGYFDQSAV